MKRVRVLVAGRVQGVFFRAACASRAREAQVGGFVRNLADGRVEAAFEGPDAAVDRLVEWCRSGPDRARVDDILVVAETVLGEAMFRVES